MQFLVPFVAALVPLLILPGLVSYFDITPKIAVLLCGTAILLLFLARNIGNFRALIAFASGRLFAILIGATWAAFALSSAFSPYPALSAAGSNWRRLGLIVETALLVFVLIAAGWLAADRNNIRTLLRAIAASGALASIYGIAQYFGWDPLLPAAAYHIGEGTFAIVRPPGTLGHADYFAAWLLIVAFCGVALERLEQGRWAKTAAFASAGLSVVALILSGTRSALLGLIAGAIVFAVLNRPRITARVALLAAICVAGATGFYLSPAGARLRARVSWSRQDALGGARLLLWRDSLRMAMHRPVAGFGPETFATTFPRFESIDLARAYPDFYQESPHNLFLDALTAQGILGTLPLLGLCALGLSAAWSLNRSGCDLAPALAAGFVGALVCQQFIVFVVPTALYFYLLVAMLVTLRAPAAVYETRTTPRWAIPIAIGGAALFAGFSICLLVSDRELEIALADIQAGDAVGAARAYQRVLRWSGGAMGSDLSYSRDMAQLATHSPSLATRLQAWQQALEAGVRATRTAEDRQNAWYNLATLLAVQYDPAGVERSLRNAIAWAPNWFKPHWTLAQLLALANHREEALQEAEAAVERDGDHDPEVSDTWKKLRRSANPSR
jgi:O-antigen ligase